MTAENARNRQKRDWKKGNARKIVFWRQWSANFTCCLELISVFVEDWTVQPSCFSLILSPQTEHECTMNFWKRSNQNNDIQQEVFTSFFFPPLPLQLVLQAFSSSHSLLVLSSSFFLWFFPLSGHCFLQPIFRFLHFSHPQTYPTHSDHGGQCSICSPTAATQFTDNSSRSCHYSLLTFLPLNLFEQFSKVSSSSVRNSKRNWTSEMIVLVCIPELSLAVVSSPSFGKLCFDRFFPLFFVLLVFVVWLIRVRSMPWSFAHWSEELVALAVVSCFSSLSFTLTTFLLAWWLGRLGSERGELGREEGSGPGATGLTHSTSSFRFFFLLSSVDSLSFLSSVCLRCLSLIPFLLSYGFSFFFFVSAANIYFLIIAILSLTPVSPKPAFVSIGEPALVPFPSICPSILSFIFSCSLLFHIVMDLFT